MIAKTSSAILALISFGLCSPAASHSQTGGHPGTPSSAKPQKQLPSATQTKSVAKTTPAYMEAANDALDSMDRMFIVISESKSMFLPAKLEVEKLLAKSQRAA